MRRERDVMYKYSASTGSFNSASFVSGLDTENTIPYVETEMGAEDMMLLVKFRFSRQSDGVVVKVGVTEGDVDGEIAGEADGLTVGSFSGVTAIENVYSSPSSKETHSVLPVAGSTTPPSGKVNRVKSKRA